MTNPYVLVVDDEPHIRHVLALKLRSAGVRVEQASHGQEALDIALSNTPALIVSDYQMPGMDGLALAQRLAASQDTAGVPVVMLTARGHRVSPGELAETNVQMVVDKPFSPRELIGLILELLEAAPGASRDAA